MVNFMTHLCPIKVNKEIDFKNTSIIYKLTLKK